MIAITPTYQQLQSIPEAIGATVKLLPLKRENGSFPDAQRLRGLVSDKTKLIVLNNPDNPTGALDEPSRAPDELWTSPRA
ncbi:aminotransferase class I/II-fold pyridoxal phosphate-dependent enzyme [Limosilactobacillus fermentum]